MNLIQRYQINRQSFQLLGRKLNDSQAGLMVPATPDWTVSDAFAHMAGVADDILAGRLEGVATDPWTAAQVEARRGRSLSELLDEWEFNAPLVEQTLMPIADEIDPRLVIDLWTHEQDVRGTVGIAGGDCDSTLDWVVERALQSWQNSIERSGLLPIRVELLNVPIGESQITPNQASEVAGGQLRIAPYEVARVLTGRRS
ncbi:MAG: hypothetical protein WD029_07335, partial [Microthrixaceae bacterium]